MLQLTLTQKRKIIASIFMIVALALGVIFYLKIEFPTEFGGYFKMEYYRQFGPLAISIEFLIAGYHLFIKHNKANFSLALFAFTALLDPLFTITGLFTSLVPIYAMILFVGSALVAFWLVFSDVFKMKRISILAVIGSFILGTAIELYFNYL